MCPSRLQGKELDALILVALLLISCALYVGTAAPTVASIFDDSLEFQVVCPTLGIAHPTGYPLYTLLGRLFSLLTPQEPARGVNVLSAICGGVAVGLLYLLCRACRCGRASALFGAVLLGLCPVYWSQATVAEVYTLNALFFAGLPLLALWAGAGARHVSVGARRAALLALAMGLGLTHHRMVLLLFAPLGAHFFLTLGRRLRRWHWRRLAVNFFAPLVLYSYIPLRGLVTSSLDGSYTNTPLGFLQHVMAAGYGVFLAPNALSRGLSLQEGAGFLLQQVGPVGLALAACGLGARWAARREKLTLVGCLALSLAFPFLYRVPDVEVFFIPALVFMSLFAGVGLQQLLTRLRQRPLRCGALAFAWLALLVALPGRLTWLDRSADWAVAELGLSWARALEPGSAVVALLGETTLLRYFQLKGQLPEGVHLLAADAEDLRLSRVRQLVRKGVPTYVTRGLPGLAEEFSLDAAGPLVRVSPVAPEGLPAGGKELVPGLVLLEQSFSATEAYGRARISVSLTWGARGPLVERVKLSLRALREGHIVASTDWEPVHSLYPTTAWRALELVRDENELLLPVGDPGGQVELQLVLYEAATGAERARFSLGEASVPPSTGRRPAWEWGLAPLLAWGGRGPLLVAATRYEGQMVGEGQEVSLDLLWRALPWGQAPPLALVLSGPKGPLQSAPVTLPAIHGGLVREQVELKLPARAEAGEYALQLCALRGVLLQWGWPPVGRCLPLGQLHLRSRERDFRTPQPQHALDVAFSAGAPVARLLGWDQQEGAAGLRIVLYWQALGEPAERYKVFVHCLSADGQVVAQSDLEPAAGRAPTSSWLQGEYISDEHFLSLAAGEQCAALLVGLYSADGSRLQAQGANAAPGGDAALLPVH